MAHRLGRMGVLPVVLWVVVVCCSGLLPWGCRSAHHHFPQPGTDLRWRATLGSTTPLTTPVLETIRID